ncbi:MAG: ABC transporter permease [Planctomycetes bacterium]|nr:ABC transporter permease [Planctomycetota bacterium]
MIAFRLRRIIVLGVRSLALHKLRSVLTALGIIFGVSSVISMLSIGEGANYEAQQEIKKLGSHNIILRSVKVSGKTGSDTEQTDVVAYGLTWKDYERIRETIHTATVLVPMRVVPEDSRFGRQSMEVRIVGTEPEYLKLGNVKLASGRGRFIVPDDVTRIRPVAVLGAHVARSLFPTQDPLYQQLRLGEFYFKVVGVLDETGAATGTGGSQGEDRNRDVYVPLVTMNKRFGEMTVRVVSGTRSMEKVELHQIIVSLESDEERVVAPTAKSLRHTLARYHNEEDYEVMVPLELLQQKERTKRIFNIVLGSIAAISLLVGGIGIMNIMLASITERTREIGIRRALGAKRRDIVTQFLVETVVLSTLGGFFGIALGVAIPYVVEATSGMKTIVTLYSLVLSFGISAAVGVIFGLYPASRAAAMDPIEALRRE